MLRSGRGEGYRAALRTAAVEDVVACVVDDPRWDRQVENREDYYASLLIQMDADVQPIVDRILSLGATAEESTCWLPIGVLAQMARRAHAAAAAGLALCVRRGQKWRACLDALEAAGSEALVGSVIKPKDIEQLLLSVGADELADAALVAEAPWEAWALALPALRFVTAARADRTAKPKPFSGPVGWLAHRLRVPHSADLLEGASVAELLQAATKPGPIRPIVDALLRREDQATEQALHSAARLGSPRERAVALHVLGRQGCVDYLDDAKEFLAAQTHGASKSDESFLRTSYVRYLEAITPELTLPLARAWLSAQWPLSHAAEQILSQRATLADRRTLEAAGEAALAAGEMYRLCAMVEGLTVIAAVESLPFLIHTYEQVPYSLARSRALTALRPHANHQAVSVLLVESLWDCESEAREIACAAVPLTDLTAVRQLRALGADVFEHAEVRKAAAGRGLRFSD